MISKIKKLMICMMAILLSSITIIAPASATQDPYKIHSAHEGRELGYLIEPGSPGHYTSFLGRYPDVKNSDGLPIWCVNVTHTNPKEEDFTSLSTLTSPTLTAPAELRVTTAQMAYLIEKYQHSNDPLLLAGVAYLIHQNFEQEPSPKAFRSKYPNTNASENIAHLQDVVRKYASFIEKKAQEFVVEAIAHTESGYQPGKVLGEGERTGKVYSLGVVNEAGKYLAGNDITVTLTGPAVFTINGTNKWSGKTSTTPISLEWKATGNGIVSASSKISVKRTSLTLLHTESTSQNTLTLGARPKIEITEVETPGPRWEVIYDFQPIGISNTQKISHDGTFIDTFKAFADTSYKNGKWLSLSPASAAKYGIPAGNIPVKYRATAYFSGHTPPTKSNTVPDNAQKIGEVEVIANGPSELSASFTMPKPGFATVVWEVRKADQGKLAELIHQDWQDGYGVPAETVSYPHKVKVDTTLSVRTTKSGIYFVDDLFVSGLPEEHGNFGGDERFSADIKDFQQSLYFFPEGLAVTDENLKQAELIGSGVKVPAKNGFHPNVGANDFKAKMNSDGTLVPGTYVFITSFAGDDRVAPFTSSAEDKNEQYLVSVKPSLHTSLTYDGKKMLPEVGTHTITDKVCYTNLQPNTEYELHGALMSLPEGKPLLDADKQEITSKKTFTPLEANGCADIEFKVNSSTHAGTRTVAFERLLKDGKEVAAHTDLTDENQTVEFMPPSPPPTPTPTPKTPPQETKLPVTGGANNIFLAIFASLTIGAGGALLWIRKKNLKSK